ncbi:MAG: response regulator [Acidobacteria bacterium]|nr:response regulator [Acidobacteriota bacterium]
MAPRSEEYSHSFLSILLVDDNKLGLLARRSILEELGYQIATANDAQEALELFAKSSFDLVITDYKMPRMNGVELIRRLKEVNSSIQVILISGFVDTLGLTEENTGSDAVIQKSANEVQQLVRAVARVLRRRTPKKPAGSAGKAAALKAKRKGVSW